MVMEKIHISEFKILNYAKKGLIDIGYPDNIEVTSYIGDNDTVMYYAEYEANSLIELGKKDKHLKPLSISDIVKLVQYAMELEGYETPELSIRVRDEKVCYSVMATIATYGNKKGKGRSYRK